MASRPIPAFSSGGLGRHPKETHFFSMSVPVHIGHQSLFLRLDPAAVLHEVAKHRPQFRTNILSCTIAQIQQVLMVHFIVMLFKFVSGILEVPDFDRQTQFRGNFLDFEGKIRYPVNLLKLIEDTIFANFRGILEGQSKTLHRVA